jgi:hypothetical protein
LSAEAGAKPVEGTEAIKPGISSQGTAIDQPPCMHAENPERACKTKWRNVLLQATAFNAFENIGNAYTGYWYRWNSTQGKWFQRYPASVMGFNYSKWSDDDPVMDDYVGHPIMGSITNYIYLRNDPHGNYLEFENSSRYWKSRLRATAFSALYSAEWKIGPLGEAGVGFSGDHYFWDKKKYTNGTGLVDFFVTPIGGLLWTIGEDYLDKHLVKQLEQTPHNPVYLTALSFLTPTHGWANLMALKAPWHRENRRVHSTWGDREASIPEDATRKSEIGAWGGGSFLAGSLMGSAEDFAGTFDVRWTRLLRATDHYALRFASDYTGAVISEPERHPKDRFTQRRRVYGAGASPLGLQMNLRPRHTVQPFFDAHAGAVYFLERLSADNGTHLNTSFDFGTGLQIMKRNHRSFTAGYRYQHFSSTNFGAHIPGVDNNIVFVGVSMFR